MSDKITVYRVTVTWARFKSIVGTRWSLYQASVYTHCIIEYDDGGAEYVLPDGYRYFESFDHDRSISHNYSGTYDVPLIDIDGVPGIVHSSSDGTFDALSLVKVDKSLNPLDG